MSAVLERQPHRVRRYRAPPGQLTARETELFHLLGRGLSNKQVAGEMGISMRTVQIHRQSMMEKVNAETPVHVGVRYAKMFPDRCGIDLVTGKADMREALVLAKRVRELMDAGSHELARALVICIEGLLAKHAPIVSPGVEPKP